VGYGIDNSDPARREGGCPMTDKLAYQEIIEGTLVGFGLNAKGLDL
jgi:hypothetical protein